MAGTGADAAAAEGRTRGIPSRSILLLGTALLLFLSSSAPGAAARTSIALSGPVTRGVVTSLDGAGQAVTEQRRLRGTKKRTAGGSLESRRLDDNNGGSFFGGDDGEGSFSGGSNSGGGATTVSGNCSVAFGGATLRYARCVALDAAGDFQLAWTRDGDTFSTWFQGTPEVPGTWAGWGISPTGMMTGSDSILGYADPAGAAAPRARMFYLGGQSASSLVLDHSSGALTAAPGSLKVEFLSSGAQVRVLANVTMPQSASGAPLTVIWAGGQGVDSFEQALLGPHTFSQGLGSVDFTSTGAPPTTGTTGTGTTGTGTTGTGTGGSTGHNSTAGSGGGYTGGGDGDQGGRRGGDGNSGDGNGGGNGTVTGTGTGTGTGAGAQSASCSLVFKGQNRTYENCVDLDGAGGFKLAWTLDKGSGVLSTLFYGTPEVAGTWASWGVSGTGKMVGGDALVGYMDPSNSQNFKVRAMHMPSLSGSSFLLDQTAGPLRVDPKSLEMESVRSGALVCIAANVSGVTSGGSVAVIWAGGQSVENFEQGLIGPHRSSQGVNYIDFSASPSSNTNSNGNSNGTSGSGSDNGGTSGSGTGSSSGSGTVGGTAVGSGCTVSFGGNDMAFEKCLDLDTGGSFKLAWTKLTSSNSKSISTTTASPTVLRTYFSGSPEVAGTWAGWGVTATGRMVGADVIVGYANPSDASQTSVRPFHLSGIAGSTFLLDQTTGPLKVVNGSMSVEFLDSGATVHILADVTGVADGQAVTVLWSGGQSVEDYSKGLLGPHSSSRALMQLDFSSASASAAQETTSNFNQKIIHAWLSTVGFGVLLPLGILVARHTKLWAGLGQAWFYAHILTQLTGYTLGTVGWGYGVWLRAQPYADLAVYPQYAHFCIGITIFCTATLQVLTPVIKPDKKAPARLYWNLVHWGLGYATVALAVANIFLGFDILSNQSIAYGGWQSAYIAFIACCGALLLLLEPLSWYLYSREKAKETDIDQKPAAQPQRQAPQESPAV